MLTTVLLTFAVVIGLFLIVAALQPTEFVIVRHTTIAAPPAVAFDQINDLQRWQEISPWAKLDPAVKNTFAGPAAGVGAIFSWSGNSKVGEGRMTITESRPPELIRFQLDFFKPFAASNVAEFAFKAEGGQTVVTWSMSGKHKLISKAFGLIVNMDKLVGRDFEKGLASLKTLAEAAANPQVP